MRFATFDKNTFYRAVRPMQPRGHYLKVTT